MLAGAVVQTSVPELNKLFGSCPHLEGHLTDLRVEWEPFQVKDAVVFGIVPPQKDDAVLVALVYAVFSRPETGSNPIAAVSLVKPGFTCSIDSVFEQNLEQVLKNVLRSLAKSPRGRQKLFKRAHY